MHCVYCQTPVLSMPRGPESLTCRQCGKQLDHPPGSEIHRKRNLAGERVECEVHGHPMLVKETLLLFGHVKVDEDYSRARAFLFPYCDDPGLGGCGGVGRETVEINVCDRCCHAREEWLRDNPPFDMVLAALDSLPLVDEAARQRLIRDHVACRESSGSSRRFVCRWCQIDTDETKHRIYWPGGWQETKTATEVPQLLLLESQLHAIRKHGHAFTAAQYEFLRRLVTDQFPTETS